MVMWVMVIMAAGTMLLLGVAAGWVLGWANKKFHVPVDPKVEALIAALPGANCGGCGFAGCAAYAEAIIKGEGPDKCPVGGPAVSAALAKVLGVELKETWPLRAVMHCGADNDARLKRCEYRGEPTCGSANVISGVQGCSYGCLGLGDCERSCKYDAIHVVNGLAVVDYDHCVGCRACEKACPRRMISMVPFKADRMTVVACSSRDPMKAVREVCTVGCIACGVCKKLNDLFALENNLATVDYERYSPTVDLSPPVAKCPRKIIHVVGKPAAEAAQAPAHAQTVTVNAQSVGE